MNLPHESDQDTIADASPGFECPLCKEEVNGPLEDHLETEHAQKELASLLAKYIYEREETGSIL